MATYYARKSGNINATDVWATTPTGTAADLFSTFTNADVLVANSFTVTVNVSTTVAEVRNDTTGGATAGGTFTLQSVTLQANVIAGSTGTCITISGSFAASIIGNITSGNNGIGVTHSSSGTLTITGAVITAGGIGVQWLTTTGSLVIVGNVSGGTAAAINNNGGSGVLTITGNVSGGTGSSGLGASFNSGGGSITGIVTGGSAAGAVGASHASGGVVTITGTAIGGVAIGATNTAGGTLNVTRAKGGPLASSAVGVNSGSSSVTNVDEIEYGDAGASPTSGPIRLTDKTSNVAIMFRPSTTKKTLLDVASTTLLPAASDVRFGTTYNSGATTGTLRVPSAANVLQGVLVDNTTGTALMTPADFWAYATASATTAGSMGERLKNAATVASTGQALADALTP